MYLRKPEELTFCCIVKLMEGGIELTNCMENPGNARALMNAMSEKPGKTLQSTLDGVFDSITLRDLMHDHRILMKHAFTITKLALFTFLTSRKAGRQTSAFFYCRSITGKFYPTNLVLKLFFSLLKNFLFAFEKFKCA